MVAKIANKVRRLNSLKLWSAITGIALTIALVLTLLPIKVDISTDGLISIDLSSTRANPSFTARTETYLDAYSLSSPYDATVAKPSGTAEGDILFALICWNHATNTIDSEPSGWIKLAEYLANTDKYALYYKVAGDSEPSTYTWSFSASQQTRIVCSCYTGGDFDPVDPIDVVSNTAYRISNTTIRAASMTVSAANSPLVFWACLRETIPTPTFTKPTIPTTDWVEDDDSWHGNPDFGSEICSMIWSGSGVTGNMDATQSGLASTTKHSFAVALNPAGEAVPPTVTTQSATNILSTSCTGNGNITDTGGENCHTRGLCYKEGTSGDPTTADSKVYDNGAGSYGTGAYNKSITSLTESTYYRVRAYAINSAGTGYGDTVQVTTLPGDSDNLTDTAHNGVSIDLEWTKGIGADYTLIRYRTDQYPTGTSDGTLGYNSTSNTTSVGSLSYGQIYYFRAWAYNSTTTLYSDGTSDRTCFTDPDAPTSFVVTETTCNSTALSWTKGTGADKTRVQYRDDQYPTTYDNGTQAYFDTGTSVNVTGLDSGQIYYFRAWSYDTESGYYDSYAQLTETIHEIPTAVTQNATNIGCTTARINGKISDDGGETCEARFRWREHKQSFHPIDPVEVTPGDYQSRVPTGDGDISGTWTKSEGSTYYELVDEEIDSYDDGNYITGTTNEGGYILFILSSFNISAEASAISLYMFIRVKDESSGTNNIAQYIKVGGSYYSGTAYNPVSNTVFQTLHYCWTKNPKTNLAWTVDDINGTSGSPLQQIGVYSTDLDPDINVSTVYAEVQWSSGSWVDIDISPYAPEGATGVVLHLAGDSIFDWAIGIRKNGSTDNRYTLCGADNGWAATGIDTNRIFEAYVQNTHYSHIYLVGYTTSGVTFFTNAYDKSLSVTGSWQDIDCFSEAPSAIGLIFEVNGDNYISMGLRMKGSSDNRTDEGYYGTIHSAIIGCNGSQVCEGYIGNTNVKFYLVGYITTDAVFNADATDFSLSTTGSWTDLLALPSSSVMGFIEVVNTIDTNTLYGLRENGSGEEIYLRACRHHWAFVECDANRLIEGKVQNVATDFYLVGYAIEGEEWTTTDWQNTLETDDTYYEDLTDLEPGTEYEVQTQARNSCGESDWTASAYFETTEPEITNTPDSYDFGILQVNTTSNTTIDYFTVTNVGNCTVDITIRGTDMSGGGGPWDLDDTGTPGEDICALWAGLDDADDLFDVIVRETATYNTLVGGLAENTTQDWGLKFYAPTSYSDGYEKSGTVTLTATAA